MVDHLYGNSGNAALVKLLKFECTLTVQGSTCYCCSWFLRSFLAHNLFLHSTAAAVVTTTIPSS